MIILSCNKSSRLTYSRLILVYCAKRGPITGLLYIFVSHLYFCRFRIKIFLISTFSSLVCLTHTVLCTLKFCICKSEVKKLKVVCYTWI